MALVTNLIAGSEARRVLLLAHGYGADERDLGGLLGYLDPKVSSQPSCREGRTRRPVRPGSRGTT
jgi:predicted esterase